MNRHKISSMAFNVQHSMEVNAQLQGLSLTVDQMYLIVSLNLATSCLIIVLMIIGLWLSSNGGQF